MSGVFNLSTGQLIGIIVGSVVGAIFLSVGVVLILNCTIRKITLEGLTGIPNARPQQLQPGETDGDKIDVDGWTTKLQGDVEELDIISSYLQPIPRWGLPSQQSISNNEPKFHAGQIGPEIAIEVEEDVPATIPMTVQHLLTLQRVTANNMSPQVAREIRKQDAAARRKSHHDQLKSEY